MMNLLLLSNSTQPGKGWLEHAKEPIKQLLGSQDLKPVFVPFAGVTLSWDDYFEKAKEYFSGLNQTLQPLHRAQDPRNLVSQTKAIIIGGGNSFYLLKNLQDLGLLSIIQNQVIYHQAKYLGWSAGSNLACPGIYTTNDMPICDPKDLRALGLIHAQINPHYTNQTLPGHGGESRDQRIAEFCVLNPRVPVLGLPEGSFIRVVDSALNLGGDYDGRIFFGTSPPKIWRVGESFHDNQLLPTN